MRLASLFIYMSFPSAADLNVYICFLFSWMVSQILDDRWDNRLALSKVCEMNWNNPIESRWFKSYPTRFPECKTELLGVQFSAKWWVIFSKESDDWRNNAESAAAVIDVRSAGLFRSFINMNELDPNSAYRQQTITVGVLWIFSLPLDSPLSYTINSTLHIARQLCADSWPLSIF